MCKGRGIAYLFQVCCLPLLERSRVTAGSNSCLAICKAQTEDKPREKRKKILMERRTIDVSWSCFCTAKPVFVIKPTQHLPEKCDGWVGLISATMVVCGWCVPEAVVPHNLWFCRVCQLLFPLAMTLEGPDGTCVHLCNLRSPRTTSWCDRACQFGLSSGLLVISAQFQAKRGWDPHCRAFCLINKLHCPRAEECGPSKVHTWEADSTTTNANVSLHLSVSQCCGLNDSLQ